MKKVLWSGFLIAIFLGIGCNRQLSSGEGPQSENVYRVIKKEIGEKSMDGETGSSLATFGNGCFWCTEAVFKRLAGVEKVVSGYSGGTIENPTRGFLEDPRPDDKEPPGIRCRPSIPLGDFLS
jgi:hypothetical protein